MLRQIIVSILTDQKKNGKWEEFISAHKVCPGITRGRGTMRFTGAEIRGFKWPAFRPRPLVGGGGGGVQTRSTASYPERLPLLVQQVGDVLRHPLHQVPGVVPLDLELAPLLIVDLQGGGGIRTSACTGELCSKQDRARRRGGSAVAGCCHSSAKC